MHHLLNQISSLCNAWLNFDDWRLLIDDRDVYDLYSDKEMFNLCHCCKNLYFALSSILHCYHKKPIIHCCQIAIDSIADYETITIMRWYNAFNLNGCFPNCHRQNGKVLLPMLLTENPDLKEALLSFCNKNLSILSAKLVHTYLFTKALPSLLEKQKKESQNHDMTITDLLQENNLRILHVHTVGNWLNLLGLKFCARRRNYSNDKHESPENITCQMDFIE